MATRVEVVSALTNPTACPLLTPPLLSMRATRTSLSSSPFSTYPKGLLCLFCSLCVPQTAEVLSPVSLAAGVVLPKSSSRTDGSLKGGQGRTFGGNEPHCWPRLVF